MSKTLTNKSIKSSYGGVLIVKDDNTGLSTLPQSVSDGLGNESPLLLSTDKVQVTSEPVDPNDVARFQDISPESATRTGLTVLCDYMPGANYFADLAGTPISGNVVLDATGAKKGAVSQLVHDASAGTVTSSSPIVVGSTQDATKVSSLFAMWDGFRFWINWTPSSSASTPTVLSALTLGSGSVASGQVTVPFTNPNSGNETQNQLYYKLNSEPTVWTAGVTAVTSATTFPAQTGLTNSLPYDFKAVAEGDGVTYSDSADSNEISATPASGVTQLTAVTLTAASIASGEVTVPFTNPNSGNEDLNQLYYRETLVGGAYTTGVTAATSATTFPAQTGLTDSTEYDFKAVAEGSGSFSDSVDSNVLNATPIASGTPIAFTLGADLVEVTTEVYENPTATVTNAWGTSVGTYTGEFNFEVLIDNAATDLGFRIGISDDNRNVRMGDAFTGSATAQYPLATLESAGAGSIKSTSLTTAKTVVLNPTPFNAGDKLHIIRNSAGNVSGYLNGTLLMDFGVFAQTVYMLIDISNGTATRSIRQPRITV